MRVLFWFVVLTRSVPSSSSSPSPSPAAHTYVDGPRMRGALENCTLSLLYKLIVQSKRSTQKNKIARRQQHRFASRRTQYLFLLLHENGNAAAGTSKLFIFSSHDRLRLPVCTSLILAATHQQRSSTYLFVLWADTFYLLF